MHAGEVPPRWIKNESSGGNARSKHLSNLNLFFSDTNAYISYYYQYGNNFDKNDDNNFLGIWRRTKRLCVSPAFFEVPLRARSLPSLIQSVVTARCGERFFQRPDDLRSTPAYVSFDLLYFLFFVAKYEHSQCHGEPIDFINNSFFSSCFDCGDHNF